LNAPRLTAHREGAKKAKVREDLSFDLNPELRAQTGECLVSAEARFDLQPTP
jgi:hypothetical protein